MNASQASRRDPKELARALIAADGAVTSGTLARAAGVTRQDAHYHLRRLVDQGELRRIGERRGARYETAFAWRRQWPREGLEEDAAWREVRDDLPGYAAAPPNVRAIVEYAFTEIVNNAIDHSGGSLVEVSALAAPGTVAFEVRDDGVGAFRRAGEAFGLDDPLDVIAELDKGKRTSAADRHSGEGIFFTSKALDRFVLTANGVRWTVDTPRGDHAVGDVPRSPGTRVRCEVATGSPRILRDVFDRYSIAPDESPAFDRTRVHLSLTDAHAGFVSRSEARRLSVGLERFAEVEVDFASVPDVGQGFADELFRVWAAGHPGTSLVPMNMSPTVRRMVERVIAYRR